MTSSLDITVQIVPHFRVSYTTEVCLRSFLTSYILYLYGFSYKVTGMSTPPYLNPLMHYWPLILQNNKGKNGVTSKMNSSND